MSLDSMEDKVTCSRYRHNHGLNRGKQTNTRLLLKSAKKDKKHNEMTENHFEDSANESPRIKQLRRTDTSIEVYEESRLQPGYKDLHLALWHLLKKKNDELQFENRRLSVQLDATKSTEQENADLRIQLQDTILDLKETKEELICTQQMLNHSASTLNEQEADDLHIDVEGLLEENGTLRKVIYEQKAQLVENDELMGSFESQTQRLNRTELELQEYKEKLKICVEQLFENKNRNLQSLDRQYSNAIYIMQQDNRDLICHVDRLKEENDKLKLDIMKKEEAKDKQLTIKYKTALESSHTRLQCKETELNDCKRELDSLTDDNRKYNNLIFALQSKIHKLEQNLLNDKNAASAMAEKYYDEIYDLQHANSGLETFVRKLTEDCDKLRYKFDNEQKRSNLSVANFEVQRQSLKCTECEQENCKKRLSEDAANMKHEIDVLQSKLTEAETTLHESKQEAEAKIQAVKKEVTAFQRRQVDLECLTEKLSKEKGKLKAVIDQERRTFANDLVESASKLEYEKQNGIKMKHELDDARTRLREMAKDEENKNNVIEELRTTLADVEHTLQLTSKNAKENTNLNSEYNAEVSKLKQESIDLKKRVDHISKENATLKDLSKQNEKRSSNEIDRLNKRIQSTEMELMDTITKLQKEGHNLKAQYERNNSNLQLEKHRLEASNADLERKIDQIKKERFILKNGNESECNALQNQLHRKEKALKEMQLELENSKKRYSEDEENMNREIAGLRSKLADAEATLLQMKKEASETIHAAKNKNIEADTNYKNELSRLQQGNIDLERLIEANETKSIETALQLANMERSGQKVKNELDETRTRLLDVEKALQQTSKHDKEQIMARENKKSKLASEYSNEVSKLTQKTTDLRKHVDELTEENDTLRDLSKQNEKLSSEKTETLRKRLQSTEMELIDTRTKLQKEGHSSKALYETTITSLQQEKHKLEESIAYLDNENDQNKKYINKLKNRLESDYGDLQKQLHRKENELKKTELELENATTRFSEEEGDMKNEIAVLRSNLAEIQATLQQTKRNAEEMIRDLESEKSDKDAQYNAELTRFQQNKMHLEKHVEKLQKENEKCKTDIDRQNQTFEKMLMETNARFENMERNYQKCKNELDETKSRMRKISEDNARKNNEIVKLQTSLANVEQTFQQTSKDAKENTKQIESEKSRVASEYSNEVSKLKQKTSDLRKHVEELKKENDTLRNLSKQNEKQSSDKIETLRKRLQSTEMELTDTRTELQKEGHSSKALYETKITSLQQEKHKLEESKAYLDNENDQKKKYINKLKNRLDSDYGDLQKQLHRKENELKETKLELENATTRFAEEEVKMENENEGLRSNLAEVQATLQETKRGAEEMRRACKNEKCDTDAQYNAELTRFQQNKILLEKHAEKLLKENEKCQTDIDRQNQTFEKMLIESNSRFENMERNCQKCNNELDETKSRQRLIHKTMPPHKDPQDNNNSKTSSTEAVQGMRKISEDNARKNNEIEKLQTSLANVEQRFQQTRKDAKGNTKQIESEKSNLVSEHNKEVSKLHQKIDDMKKHIEDLSTENDKLKSYNKQNEKRSSNDIDTLNQRLQSTEMDLLDARKKLQKEKEKHNSQAMYETTITNLKEEKRKLEVCKADLETKNGQMKRDIINLENGLGSNQKSARYSDSDYDALQKQLRRREKELKDTELELEDTKTRLSKCMGDKLTNNNPNIVDLSDMNRPSKLADRYKELYDNQWTDAYEMLEKSEGSEQHIICILLNVLIETKRFCDDQTHTEMNDILRSIAQNNKVQVSDVPVGVLKYIKDCRKSSAPETMKVKYKEYRNELKRGSVSFAKQALAVNEYLNECFEICWLMSIQDPPVVLSPLLKHGDSFRTDLYCAYTASGKIVEYIVWPALLLHENGPTLTKGVAQGMKRV